ncbi:MAG2960 family serine endopeptidase lipoprotein [Metamycoplasma alkalescens]|uniref:MAG2960 family serine endopeptidase lipoprotein n=1 Tax=Metamycoplasma alkalescens TaxID=45363 RepID=UPI003D04BCAC
MTKNKFKLISSLLVSNFPLLGISCQTKIHNQHNEIKSNEIKISIPNKENLVLNTVGWNDVVLNYDREKYDVIKDQIIKNNDNLIIRIKIIEKYSTSKQNVNEIIKEETFFNFKNPTNDPINNPSNLNPSKNNNEESKPNIKPIYHNNEKLVYDDSKIYTINKNPQYFLDSHLFDDEFLFNNDVYTITRKTPKFKTASHNINVFLRNGNNGSQVDFRSFTSNNDIERQFWEHAKDIGFYGHYGNNSREKVAFYNDHISVDGMVKQSYLNNFNEKDKDDAKVIKLNHYEIIKKNPFGYLPSNLNQLFYYMNFKSISKLLNIENIIKIQSNFNDEIGEIELLITNKNNQKYYLKIDKTNTSYLKSNLDFYQYIYDRSFMMLYYGTEWFRDPFRIQKEHLGHTSSGGSMWVVDRIINKEAEKQDYWELLVATNIHVFSLNKIFDKSLYFRKNDNNINSKWWKAGFYDPNDWDNYWNNLKNRTNAKFMTLRAKDEFLSSNSAYVDKNEAIPTIESYSQYLDMPYYTPRYEINDFMIDHPDTAGKWFEEYDSETRIGKTKNAGADFVLLKIKIKKSQLKLILPKLDEIIGTNKEKDWYIGLGKNELMSPYKTQFYAGYPNFSFKGNKSIGGIISTQNRYVKDDDFKSLWVRYNESLNKDWNSHKNNWEEYTKPFVENEHGMPLNILTQHSTLYTRIEKNEKHNALDSGSSGSMVIDSSFNLVGINYLLTEDFEHDTTTNAINLIQGQGDYKNKNDGNILENVIKKLKSDNLHTIKLNPN